MLRKSNLLILLEMVVVVEPERERRGYRQRKSRRMRRSVGC